MLTQIGYVGFVVEVLSVISQTKTQCWYIYATTTSETVIHFTNILYTLQPVSLSNYIRNVLLHLIFREKPQLKQRFTCKRKRELNFSVIQQTLYLILVQTQKQFFYFSSNASEQRCRLSYENIVNEV